MPLGSALLVGAWGLRAAAGPLTVGPLGAPPPPVDGTVVTVAPAIDGALTVGVTVRAAATVQDLTFLWPMAGIRQGTLARMDPAAFARVEATTRARVEGLSCADLVETLHWRSVPGCTSYDFVPPPPDRGADAVDSVGLGGEIAGVELSLELIEGHELEDWLDRRGFAVDPAALAGLEPHLQAGEPILTVQAMAEVSAGTWLPPVRFVVDAAEPGLVLPLRVGEPLATGRQVLTVLSGGEADQPNPTLGNFPRAYVPAACMLRPGESAAGWMAQAREAFEADAALPTWVLVHAGPARRCSPCTAEPLEAVQLAAVGVPANPAEARLSRLWLEWDAGGLDEDPVLTLDGAPGDASLRFVANAPEIAAYFPLCGEGAVSPDAGACPNLGGAGGCRTARRPVGALAVAAAAVALAALLRRRRLWSVLAGLVLFAAPVRAADADGGPRSEVGAGISLVGTDRIVPTGLDHGAPWLLNPFLAVEARHGLHVWRRGRSLGVLGQLKGLAGRAAPWGARGEVGFVLLEPAIGIDARHGRFRETNRPALFGRYGASVVLTTVVPTVAGPRAVPSGALHAGLGAWFGRGPRRPGAELRIGVVPRTDAFETRFHPNVELAGWRFFPGTVNLWIVASRAWYAVPGGAGRGP